MKRFVGWIAVAGTSVALILTVSLNSHLRPVSASSDRSGQLRITKNCDNNNGSAGAYCTITSSNLPEIPVNARVYYDQAFGIPATPSGIMLDSNVVLYVATGDWASGRCTLDGVTGLGLCTFSDGVGRLTGFHGRVDVSPTGGGNFDWKGTYSFSLPRDQCNAALLPITTGAPPCKRKDLNSCRPAVWKGRP